jgi:bacterioferritin
MKEKDKNSAKGNDQKSFLTDITEIRRRARQHIEDGAVTDGYKGDRKVVLRVLNEALATEIVFCLSLTSQSPIRPRYEVATPAFKRLLKHSNSRNACKLSLKLRPGSAAQE